MIDRIYGLLHTLMSQYHGDPDTLRKWMFAPVEVEVRLISCGSNYRRRGQMITPDFTEEDLAITRMLDAATKGQNASSSSGDRIAEQKRL